eukprot:15327954-Ditylum_brightwellii.AAC.1
MTCTLDKVVKEMLVVQTRFQTGALEVHQGEGMEKGMVEGMMVVEVVVVTVVVVKEVLAVEVDVEVVFKAVVLEVELVLEKKVVVVQIENIRHQLKRMMGRREKEVLMLKLLLLILK